jgi:sialate O-acetylesterase
MEMCLLDCENGEAETDSADFPDIRRFLAEEPCSDEPLEETHGYWEVCTPSLAGYWTGAGYYFAREILEYTGAPQGIVQCAVGGTRIETWMSLESLLSIDMTDDFPMQSPNTQSCQYNAKINGLFDFAVKGITWYQGEANASLETSGDYQTLLSAMISDWREKWKNDSLPFLCVQLSGHMPKTIDPDSTGGYIGWPELMEAQQFTVQSIHNAGLAVTCDIGCDTSIHPLNKKDIGYRLSLIARTLAYGEKDPEYSGPEWDRKIHPLDNGRIRISFNHAVSGLDLREDSTGLSGFTVAGEDEVFYWADAETDGNSVLLSAVKVDEPRYIRYAWASNPICPLYNKEGLPASPFRFTWDKNLSARYGAHINNASVKHLQAERIYDLSGRLIAVADASNPAANHRRRLSAGIYISCFGKNSLPQKICVSKDGSHFSGKLIR